MMLPLSLMLVMVMVLMFGHDDECCDTLFVVSIRCRD
jgi:hypothetical protein